MNRWLGKPRKKVFKCSIYFTFHFLVTLTCRRDGHRNERKLRDDKNKTKQKQANKQKKKNETKQNKNKQRSTTYNRMNVDRDAFRGGASGICPACKNR